jgi:hypothetical protein
MSRVTVCALAVSATVWLTHTAAAQTSHLKLQSAEDKRDEYSVILRKVFKRIYGSDVVLSTLCVPSFVPEEAAGILQTRQGYQVFAATPSASTWETEYSRFIKQAGPDGREVPYNRAENLKKGLPYDYRGIKVRIQARPVSADLAERIKKLWQAKLLHALHPPRGPDESERYIVTDGVSYYYSMALQGHGTVTAEGQLILENTPVWLMGELSDKLISYAKGKASEEDLKKAVTRVESKKA